MMFLKCVPEYFGLSQVNISFVDLPTAGAIPTITARIRSARFNLASLKKPRHRDRNLWMVKGIMERVACPRFAPVRKLAHSSQSHAKAPRFASALLAVVRAAAHFESDERCSAARDIRQKAQGARRVLESDACLRVAAFELPPRFWNGGDAARRPQLCGFGSGFSCVQLKAMSARNVMMVAAAAFDKSFTIQFSSLNRFRAVRAQGFSLD
jgi:hypothetical protein